MAAAIAAGVAYWIYRRELEHRRTERLNDALAKVIEAVGIEEAAFDELVPRAYDPDRRELDQADVDRIDRVMRTRLSRTRWEEVRTVRRTTRSLLFASKLTATGDDIAAVQSLTRIHEALDSVSTPRAKIGLYDALLTLTNVWREGQGSTTDVPRIAGQVVQRAIEEDRDGLEPEDPGLVT